MSANRAYASFWAGSLFANLFNSLTEQAGFGVQYVVIEPGGTVTTDQPKLIPGVFITHDDVDMRALIVAAVKAAEEDDTLQVFVIPRQSRHAKLHSED